MIESISRLRSVELGMISCMGVFNPIFATYRQHHTEDSKMARVLTAWTITTRTATAVATAVWGVLASLTTIGPRSRLQEYCYS